MMVNGGAAVAGLACVIVRPAALLLGFWYASDVFSLLRDLANRRGLVQESGAERRDKGRRFSSNRPSSDGANQLLDRVQRPREKK